MIKYIHLDGCFNFAKRYDFFRFKITQHIWSDQADEWVTCHKNNDMHLLLNLKSEFHFY